MIAGFFTWIFMGALIQVVLFSWWWGMNDFTLFVSIALATWWMFITVSGDETSSSSDETSSSNKSTSRNKSNGSFGIDTRKFTGSDRKDAQKIAKLFGIGKSSKK